MGTSEQTGKWKFRLDDRPKQNPVLPCRDKGAQANPAISTFLPCQSAFPVVTTEKVTPPGGSLIEFPARLTAELGSPELGLAAGALTSRD